MIPLMFQPTSRYFNLGTNTFVRDDKSLIKYTKRRFIPPSDNMTILQKVAVIAGDRIDLVSARTLGDPELFWRICDANNAMHPLDLTDKPGSILDIPLVENDQ